VNRITEGTFGPWPVRPDALTMGVETVALQ
jgi:hypothetical protein